MHTEDRGQTDSTDRDTHTEGERMKYKDVCLICGKPVDDYKPEMCCNGQGCGCMGLPINPCTCSQECEDALFAYIGHTYEERRLLANSPKWKV